MTRDRLVTLAVVVVLAIALHRAGLTAPAVALLSGLPAVVDPPTPFPVAPDDGGPPPSPETDG